MKQELIEELKKLTEESPTEDNTEIQTLKDLSVSLIDYTKNPYRSMFEMSLQTWGSPDKWEKASPELRFEVVKKVLEKKALPLALEAAYFSFQITNCARAAFDQIARTRIGVVYAARGFKDNYLNYTSMIIPDRIPEYLTAAITEHYGRTKQLYRLIQDAGVPNWAARCIIPMYTSYNFIMVMHFSTLQNFCSNRMETTEMEDTVGVAWLMREAVKKEFPLLAEYLRPGCDWRQKDTTVNANGFAEEMGIIHNSDYRNPGFNKLNYDVRYEEPCTDINKLSKDLKITIPKPTEWIDYTWETLSQIDKDRFND